MISISEKSTLTPKGKLTLITTDAVTGDIIDKTVTNNVVVEDARFILLRGIGADTSPNYHITDVKLGRDFVNTWQPIVGNLTTDVADPTKRHLVGFATDFINDMIPTPADVIEMNAGNLWIQIPSTGERRKVISIDSPSSLYVDVKFDTDLVNQPFEYVIGASPDEPELPLATFDNSSMDVVYFSNGAYTFTKNFDTLIPKVDFQFTVIGQNVVDAQLPTIVSNVVFSSAALHTGNGNLFSYIRFPKVSISPLINITFIWSIYFD